MEQTDRKRYFFFDYDGTLALPRTYTIPEGTMDALRRLEANGHFVALATGRLQCNALDYVKSAGITNIVADGGYSVTLGGELMHMEPLELAPIVACLHRLDAAGIPWAVTTKNELVRYSPCEEFDKVSADYYVPTKFDPTMSADSLECVYKAYIPCKRGADQERLIASGILEGVPWARYNSDNIFVEPTDKQRGIRKMMDLLGADYADVVVFGNGSNDLGMFVDDWLCIAMEDGIEELKVRADYVCGPCDGDGIRQACEHFGWI